MVIKMELLTCQKIISGGRVHIPKSLRDLLSLSEGDYLNFIRDDNTGQIIIKKAEA